MQVWKLIDFDYCGLFKIIKLLKLHLNNGHQNEIITSLWTTSLVLQYLFTQHLSYYNVYFTQHLSYYNVYFTQHLSYYNVCLHNISRITMYILHNISRITMYIVHNISPITMSVYITSLVLQCLFYTKLSIRVITKLPNSEQSYKGKVKTHKYINTKSVNNWKTVKTVMTLTWYRHF